jgi:hypothetical protein
MAFPAFRSRQTFKALWNMKALSIDVSCYSIALRFQFEAKNVVQRNNPPRRRHLTATCAKFNRLEN